jgi:hypothetical protein
MDPHAQLGYLVELAESVGITIRRIPAAGDSAEHPGGALVCLKGLEILMLDSAAAAADQIAVVAGALRGRAQVEDRFLPPEIREAIERS